MRAALPLVLLATSLALGAGVVYELAAPLDPVAVETPRVPVRPARTVAPLAYVPPAEELFADIDARPLFSASRKPLPDLAQASGAATATSDFALAGVIMGGERAVALLRIKSTASTASAVVGDLVNGWRVVHIAATSVTLRANGSDFTVPLDGPASQAPGAPLPSASAEVSIDPIAPPAEPVSAAPEVSIDPIAPPVKAVPTKPEVPIDPIAPPAKPPAIATTAPKPALPAHPGNGTISPEALKGAPIDPATGAPTL